MPCWPDIWEYLKNVVPLPFGLFVYVVFVALLLWAPKTHKNKLRVACRVLGAVALVPLVVILFPIALSIGPPSESRVLISSDGHEATLSYDAGFLGRDYTEVRLKQPGCCRHTTVFRHFGPSGFDDPKLEWLDSHHLKITYHTRPDDAQECEKQVGQVSVICTSEPWPWLMAKPASPAAPTEP